MLFGQKHPASGHIRQKTEELSMFRGFLRQMGGGLKKYSKKKHWKKSFSEYILQRAIHSIQLLRETNNSNI